MSDMDTKTTTVTTTTTTITTTTTVTTSSTVKKRLRRLADIQEELVPVPLLSRLKDCRVGEDARDADAEHPTVVALRELIAGGDCGRVARFIYSNPRILRLRLIERAVYMIYERMFGEYKETNLHGVDLEHAQQFEGLYLPSDVFSAVSKGTFVDEDSDSDSESKSGGESKAQPDDEEGDDEDEDEGENEDPESPTATDSDKDESSQDEDGDEDEDEDEESSSSDSDSDNELLLDKQARQERRAKEQDKDAKRAEAYQDTKAQEAAEDKDAVDDIPVHQLSEFDSPLLSDSVHWSNARIINGVVLPWCRRVSTTGGPMSRLLAMLKLLEDIKEQYLDGFTSSRQVKIAFSEALHSSAHGEDWTKSEQMRLFYTDWVGNKDAAGEMSTTGREALKRLPRQVKSYRAAAEDSERKDNLRLELGQTFDQALKPVDTLLCILREAVRFETQARKLELEVIMLQIESRLLKSDSKDEKQINVRMQYEAYHQVLGSSRAEILRLFNPDVFSNSDAATAYLKHLGIDSDAIRSPERLVSKSLAFVLALGHADLEQTYYRDPSIVSSFHYADYDCADVLLSKKREWIKSLASIKTQRMNERTLITMCDTYNTSNQHSGLVPLESKFLLAPNCEERLAPIIASLTELAEFARVLYEFIERNRHASTCLDQLQGCGDILLNPLGTVLNERSRQSIKECIVQSEVAAWYANAMRRESKEHDEKDKGGYDTDPDEFTTVRSRTARDIISEFPNSFELAERPDEADWEVVTPSDEDPALNARAAARDYRARKRRRLFNKNAGVPIGSDSDTDTDDDQPMKADADGDVDMDS